MKISTNRIENGLKEQSIFLRPAKPEFGEGLQFAYYLDQAAEGFSDLCWAVNQKAS